MTTHSTPGTTAPLPIKRHVVRAFVDFGLGLALFAMVLGALSIGHGSAIAGTEGWIANLTADQVVPLSRIETAVAAHRQAPLVLLAISFGLITALNMSIARHLRMVLVPVRQSRDNAG